MPLLHPLAAIVGYLSLGVAATYSTLTLIAVLVWQRRKPAERSAQRPPLTVLKPLCGNEPGLYEHLRGFCRQDYPQYQIVFGVRDSADPARLVAERLAAEFPTLPIDVVVNPELHGSNGKVSNLINMLDRARHEILVIADSDAFVGPDYLATVTAPLLDARVGLVTCAYRGVPTRSVWSRLGAMYINEWYVPSILLAWLFGYEGYVSGQTMCLRHETLRAIGGLRTIADHLADDHRLGELIRGLGLRIVLSPYLVGGEHHEQNMRSLTRHELRWMRTIQVLRPASFRMIFLSFSLPLAVLGMVLAFVAGSPPVTVWALFGIAALIRLVLHFIHRLGRNPHVFSDLWLLPVRDLLLCCVWVRSFFSSRVIWRGIEFEVDAEGFMRRST
ncbi:MAG: bacteriohopanetetrol glucosamine biosynthesis glycosyltransferase HpnI [Pseudomonadota bacterium]|nr:bacteriohopanetetrol glucosamine biosynthesis glycosyltransferase HpnI [Pseudomonadota bacterium]